MGLQVVEEILPLLAKPVCYVVPEALDARIVDAAAPNIQASVGTSSVLHPGRNFDVFGAMIPRTRLGTPCMPVASRNSLSTLDARLLLFAWMPVTNRDLPSMKQCKTILYLMSPRNVDVGTRG